MKYKNSKKFLLLNLICTLIFPHIVHALDLTNDDVAPEITEQIFSGNTDVIPVKSDEAEPPSDHTTLNNPNEDQPVLNQTNLSEDNMPNVPVNPELLTNPTSVDLEKKISLVIRSKNDLLFLGEITIPSSTIIVDNQGVEHFTTSSNVLTALIAADEISQDFQITDLAYYESYNSFYLNCLQKTNPEQTFCENWNYAVNTIYPGVGMDNYQLNGGENIYIYFDNPWKISATTSTFHLNTTATFNTWRYDFSNLQNEWLPDTENLIDISVDNPNPSSTWDTTMTVTTTMTDASGTIDFVFSSTGTYYAKITSLDWSKWSNPITLTVLPESIEPIATTTPNHNQNPNTGSGSNPTQTAAAIPESKLRETAEKILHYLKSLQLENGQINDGPMSDWAIMSFGSYGTYSDSIKNDSNISLYDSAKNYDFSDTAIEMNVCASYPRHILALLATGASTNDTKILHLNDKILTECFRDEKYGWDGINDDVFALMAILAIDDDISNPIIKTIIDTIKADQQSNGAFTWNGYPGADITGGAIASLKNAKDKGVNIEDIFFTKAKSYLKSTQINDGGWGYDNTNSDILTTSWVIMGINALGEGQNEWQIENNSPWSPLVNKLANDGSYKSTGDSNTTDWFGTKHAVPALLQKTWPIIMPEKFFNQNIGTGTPSEPLPASTSHNTTTTGTPETDAVITTTLDITSSTISTTTTTEMPNTSTPSLTIQKNIPTTTPRPKKNQKMEQKKIIAGNKISTSTNESTPASTTPTTPDMDLPPNPPKNRLPGIIIPSTGLILTLSALAWRKRRGVL